MTDRSLSAAHDQPLIAIPLEEDGREVVRYFTDDEAADAATAPRSVEEALALASVWSDLDWSEMEQALDRRQQQVLLRAASIRERAD